ncbi:MAG: ATPase P [Syntrophomonadaceae bacterium]|nr:ATPase P [Syntrophomonadaceae bacterium]
MLRVEIPGSGLLELEYLLLDYNGTLAEDGELLPGVKERLDFLAGYLKIYVLTADTFGKACAFCSRLPVKLLLVKGNGGYLEKEQAVKKLGPDKVVSIGNGYNDHLMLKASWLGILVLGPEGAAVQSLLNADVVTRNIEEALDLLIHPQRLAATLRT